jgi:hypothetical protein
VSRGDIANQLRYRQETAQAFFPSFRPATIVAQRGIYRVEFFKMRNFKPTCWCASEIRLPGAVPANPRCGLNDN